MGPYRLACALARSCDYHHPEGLVVIMQAFLKMPLLRERLESICHPYALICFVAVLFISSGAIMS